MIKSGLFNRPVVFRHGHNQELVLKMQKLAYLGALAVAIVGGGLSVYLGVYSFAFQDLRYLFWGGVSLLVSLLLVRLAYKSDEKEFTRTKTPKSWADITMIAMLVTASVLILALVEAFHLLGKGKSEWLLDLAALWNIEKVFLLMACLLMTVPFAVPALISVYFKHSGWVRPGKARLRFYQSYGRHFAGFVLGGMVSITIYTQEVIHELEIVAWAMEIVAIPISVIYLVGIFLLAINPRRELRIELSP